MNSVKIFTSKLHFPAIPFSLSSILLLHIIFFLVFIFIFFWGGGCLKRQTFVQYVIRISKISAAFSKTKLLCFKVGLSSFLFEDFTVQMLLSDGRTDTGTPNTTTATDQSDVTPPSSPSPSSSEAGEGSRDLLVESDRPGAPGDNLARLRDSGEL